MKDLMDVIGGISLRHTMFLTMAVSFLAQVRGDEKLSVSGKALKGVLGFLFLLIMFSEKVILWIAWIMVTPIKDLH